MTTAGDELERLPADARPRLEAFAGALERVHVDDLPLYVARRRQPTHRRAVELAALTAREHRLEASIDGARRAIRDYALRAYAGAAVRSAYPGLGGGPSLADPEERLRILRSLDEAVAALVLGERIDAGTRGELLGLWDRLVP